MGEAVGKKVAGVVEFVEGEARVVDNSSEVEGTGGLVESPERLGKVGVKLEEGSEKVLRDFLSGEGHLIEGSEEREKPDACSLKARSEFGGGR